MKIESNYGSEASIIINKNFALNNIITDSDGNPTDLVYGNIHIGSFSIRISEAKVLIEKLTKDIDRVEKQFEKFLNPVAIEQPENNKFRMAHLEREIQYGCE